MADPQGRTGGAERAREPRSPDPASTADGGAAPAGAAAMGQPVVAEALKKAAVAWVAVGEAPPLLLWCLPVDGALYVVSGPGEQAAPGLAWAQTARVTLRGDHGGRIVTWPAVVTRVDPDSEEWTAVAPQLAAKRLNAPEPAPEVLARWAAECAVNRLAPAGEPAEAGATLPDAASAEPPRDTPARRRTARPFRLHRVRTPDPSS